MPRSNRRRPDPDGEDSFGRFLAGFKRTEYKRGAEWVVQPMGAGRSEKAYTCPGCGGMIDIGAAHEVVWRADGVLGDRADLAARRHWHPHCWRIS